MRFHSFLLLAAASCSLVTGCENKTGTESPAPAAAEAARSVGYEAAIADVTRGYFQSLPEIATYNGASAEIAPGANARLNDRSPAGEAARRAEMETLLAELKSVDVSALDADQARIAAALSFIIEGGLAPAHVADYGSAFGTYGLWFMPYAIVQNSGPTVDIPNMLENAQQVRNAEEAETYLTRLSVIDETLDGALEKLKTDVALGATPPDFIILKSKAVTDAFAAPAPEDNVLVASFKTKLEKAGVAGADDYVARARVIVADEVYPAYARISAYLGEIAPAAPHDAGVWRLPNGAAFYEAMVRNLADGAASPDDIHQIGLDEVARITAEMDALLKAQGYTEGTVGERMAKLGAEPRFVYPDTEEGKQKILDDIEGQLAAVNAALPDWFGELPKYDVVVRRVPAFSEASAPGGYYDSPAPDGSRPGTYWINLRDTAIWPHFAVPTLTFHEAIPGHHMQGALALAQDAPLIVKTLQSNPSGEGWALYAEALAAEMGLYADDPYGDLGRLQDEIHRAIRLVVDTGMHWKRWSREEAIDYMVRVEGAEPSEAESEIERYVVWPGQALGYKIGMLKIQALRREAEEKLGDDFDIRAFHDRVLSVASMPLPVIETEIKRWINAELRRRKDEHASVDDEETQQVGHNHDHSHDRDDDSRRRERERDKERRAGLLRRKG
ncbi:MAG: DUF885 domain-containing protein [Parvularculaceae bacterium]